MRCAIVLAALGLASMSTAVAQAPPPAGFPGTPPPSPPAIIRELTAEPAAIEPGGATTLRWEALNVYSLTIDPVVGSVATRGARFLRKSARRSNNRVARGPCSSVTNRFSTCSS